MTTSSARSEPGSSNAPAQAGRKPGNEVSGKVESIDAVEAAALPTSFGAFKPVGHLMIGVRSQEKVDSVVTALRSAGWFGNAIRQFAPLESAAELQAMIDNAGGVSGFGYELTLLRHYLSLTEAGYRWLLVKADDQEVAARAAAIARAQGATVAVHYRMLTVEELIP